MQQDLVQEVAGLVFDIGQEAGFVSPSIQKLIKAADARSKE
jgi:hypothetical protein